ncbi:lanthionine synthetase C family protein [Streptomyces sp. NPDC056716]|uniref:lanthionine synthetase C family protein n=1 Tax=unclassified Streptomyces TaxID=2593676 RepID=UPI0036A7AF79
MTTLQNQAARTALDIAHNLRSPDTITRTVSERAAHTLCYGLAGTALLHACLAHTDPASARLAAEHWDAAAHHLGNAPADGIHTGPGALAASLIIGTGYLPTPHTHRTTLTRATTWLSARVHALAHHHRERSAHHQATPWAVYDTIKGLTGIGRILLAAHHRGQHAEAEPGLTAALSALTHMILTPHGKRPGWWIPADLHPSTVEVPATGAATTGLAHGIAGPLALLSIAHHAGHTVPGQTDAIHTAAQWLLTRQTPDHTWPPHISAKTLDNPATRTPSTAEGRTTAWCYGTPGIATALTHAALTTGHRPFRRTAEHAMNALAARPPSQWDTEGSALCHGSAGVLHSARRLACPELARLAANSTLDSTPARRPEGFLTGRAGTALVLADLGALLPQPDDPWDSILLIS